MNIATLKTFMTLYSAAETVNTNWEGREAVDWSEAEELVGLIREIDVEERQWCQGLNEILEHADQDDWDSGIVGNWPSVITGELENLGKAYDLREDGENWEVFSLSVTGEEEWKGTVETQCIAETLVSALDSKET